MSATEELRCLLKERSIEWYETVNTMNCVFTWWESPLFGEVHAMDNEDGKTLFMACLNNCDFTPEQAIAATLGEECKQVLVDCNDGLLPPFKAYCSKCGAEWGYTPKYCPNCGRKVKQWTAKSVEMTVSN